ncbi:response regulator [Blastococcus sp. SYSU D00813]
MVTVMVVEDNEFVRDALVAMLTTTPDVSVVAECCDGEDVLDTARRFRPDVVLMDIVLPGLDGLEATRRLLQEDPDTRVVMLTGHLSVDHVRGARALGADGFLLKDGDPADVAQAIRTVAGGGTAWDPAVDPYLLQDDRPGPRDGHARTPDGRRP